MVKQMTTSHLRTSIDRSPFQVILFLIPLVLVCFALSSKVQAVIRAPDGNYPGGNTAEGASALLNLTTGTYNTAVGWLSLRTDTAGSLNTAIGAGTLFANTGDQNTATGAAALFFNAGSFSTANGAQALLNNTTGGANTANGVSALQGNTTDSANTAVGAGVLVSNTTGIGNTAIGANAGDYVTTANNVICIGWNVHGQNVDGSCYIGNIFGQTSSGGTPVFINSEGKLGTTTSSRRFKKDIEPMEGVSKALYALKPVTFRYKRGIDPRGIPQFGLLAEDVEEVNPDLVVRDKEGKVNTVRYEAINAMLLNEFLKEHRKVQELEKNLRTTIVRQQKQIKALTATVQRVSDQSQLSKPAPHIVTND